MVRRTPLGRRSGPRTLQKGLIMKESVKLILILLFFSLFIADRCLSQESEDQVERVSHMVEELLRGSPRVLGKDEEKRRRFAGWIVAAAEEYETPPGLLTGMSFRESSFRSTAVGYKRGEIGLLQIHGRALTTCPHKDTIEKPESQLRCGSRWLRVAYDLCGETWEGALTAYASGKCKPPNIRTRRVVADRLRLWKKLEEYVDGLSKIKKAI